MRDGRAALAPIAERAAQLAWSDVASAIALVVLGALWLYRSVRSAGLQDLLDEGLVPEDVDPEPHALAVDEGLGTDREGRVAILRDEGHRCDASGLRRWPPGRGTARGHRSSSSAP